MPRHEQTVPADESLLTAARRFTRAGLSGNQAISHSTLSQGEWHLLWLLRHWPERKGARPSELALRQRVTPGNVAQQLRRLEGKRLVVRSGDKRDRRVVLVKLTAAGTRTLRQAQAEFVKRFKTLEDQLGLTETRQLIRLLLLAAEHLEKTESDQ